jgi:transposase
MRRISNAVSEALNSTIQKTEKRAHGFSNRDHFKTVIFLHCGGLSPAP